MVVVKRNGEESGGNHQRDECGVHLRQEVTQRECAGKRERETV